MNRILPLSGPSSLSPGSPVGTHGRVLGLRKNEKKSPHGENKWSQIQVCVTGAQREKMCDALKSHQTGRRCRAGLWPGAAEAGTESRSSRRSFL